MNAVDYTRHVLAVVQIRGSRIENLKRENSISIMYCNEHNLTVSCQVCQPMAPETVMPHSQALMHGGMETGNETSTIDSRCTE